VVNVNRASRARLLWLLGAAVGVTGCELIAGIGDRSLAPDASAAGGRSGDAGGPLSDSGLDHPTGTGGAPDGGSMPGSGGSGGAAGAGGAHGSGGTVGSGGAVGTGGVAAGTGGAATGTGGVTSGTGGAKAGTGGALAGTGGAVAGTGGAMAGTGGIPGTGGSGPDFCPSNATFCSGFETVTAGPPAGATLQVYTGMFSDVMAIDTTVANTGHQSLKVLSGTSVSAFRMLSVPIPGSTFWVRLYARSDSVFGNTTANHNSFFQAMVGTTPTSSAVQVAEQFCQVLLNASDSLFPTGLSECSATGPSLAANQWHCMEAFFDGPNGNVQVYGDGSKMIDAAGWAPAKLTFATFAFGFAQYSGPARTVWYDDVAVGPTRIGCP
jgi:hypothetical protein